ncbi:MAG TPA: hypothetical protein VGH80_09990 [Xanthomonadaceae bacterium]|jgi:hypothetical protein
MSEPASTATLANRQWMLVLGIVFPLLALIFLGQDVNWDLQNYHLYDPFAWLHGRLHLDIAPAQIQSWHNPLLDVPMYLMAAAHWPGFVVCLWLTLPSMLTLYLLLRMQALLGALPPDRVRTTALAVLAMGGVGFFAEIGTCLDDAFVAAGALGSLYLVLREEPGVDRGWVWCVAGALAGATAGLKLTAAPYCLGLAGAAIAWPSWRRMPLRLASLALGGIAGVALTYGYWGMLLWHLHGNPFFPYYNQVFHSPDASIAAYTDARFQPASVGDALLVPLRLLAKSQRYSEMVLKDPRLLLGVVAWAVLSWRARRVEVAGDAARNARTRAVAGYFLVAFLAWSLQYGVYRYAIPLEMLGCLGLVLMLERLPRQRIAGGTVIACLLAIAASYPASWGRTHFQSTYVDVRMPPLAHGAMVVISGWSPLAFAATALPDDVPVIGIDNTLLRPHECGALSRQARSRIATHEGPLWLLRGGDPADDEGQRIAAVDYGLVVAGPCKPVATSFGTLRLCPLRRDPSPSTCPASPAPGR